MAFRHLNSLLVLAATACSSPAESPEDCGDAWRPENASDCRVRLALEAWDRSPEAGERAILALPAERVERDYVWMKVAETRCWSEAICDRIVDPAFARSCSDRLPRPWLRPGAATASCPPGVVVRPNGPVPRPDARNPDAAGRLGARWNIAGGKVVEPALTQNTTGDEGVGACVVKAVRAMRFDPGLTATVDEYVWVVSGQ